MARLPLSKSQLAREKENLASYNRYLPALDLKRQQLMAARNTARAERARLERELTELLRTVGAELPMLADRRIDLDGLVRLTELRIGAANVAGVRVPKVEAVQVTTAPYGRMVRPHWVDALAARLAEGARLRAEIAVAAERVAVLDKAVTRITQRVNLFEKILKPEAEANIRRILVYLGDAERAAVVGAKIAKTKRALEAARTAAEGAAGA